ncbi:hypothetical protein WB401_36190 [Streptomyces brasiliscabiei]|uniref:Uncharacterized protein n=1 Tax=Streptomyces brasiliscabiei TaxID=2736302 RepID=A0ABU8GNA8_9ACTN
MIAYENEVRDYVTCHQDTALEYDARPGSASGGEQPEADSDTLPDFGTLTLPLHLKDFSVLVRP